MFEQFISKLKDEKADLDSNVMYCGWTECHFNKLFKIKGKVKTGVCKLNHLRKLIGTLSVI